MKYFGLSCNLSESLGISCGVPWNSRGILWSPMNSHGNLWNVYGITQSLQCHNMKKSACMPGAQHGLKHIKACIFHGYKLHSGSAAVPLNISNSFSSPRCQCCQITLARASLNLQTISLHRNGDMEQIVCTLRTISLRHNGDNEQIAPPDRIPSVERRA